VSHDREPSAHHGHGHGSEPKHGSGEPTASLADPFERAMQSGRVASLAAAVVSSGDFVRDELMRRIQERFGNAVAAEVLEATASPLAFLDSTSHSAAPQSMQARAARRRHPASDRAAGGAERATASLAGIEGHIAAFAAARDQLDGAGARTHGEAIAATFERAGAAREAAAAAGATVAKAEDAELADELSAEMKPVLERAAAEVGPHRFAGQAVGGAPEVHAAGNLALAVMRLRSEAERTIALVDIAARIRDLWTGSGGQPSVEIQRAIGAQLAHVASRPVHFAFVKAALTSIEVWDYVATYDAPKAARDPATFGGIVANATAEERTIADLDRDVARQARQFGALVDLHDFDQATAIELLQGDTGITYLDNQETLVSRSSKHAPQVLAMMRDLDAAARSAVLEHFRKANVLDLFCGGLPWRQVRGLDAELTAGHAEVRAELGRYYMHRDTTDHSVSHMLERIPGVGGALETVANVATFGFLRSHDDAYRAERQGIITDQQFAEVTVDAAERAGAALAVSTVTGGVGAGLGRGAAGVALGEAATTTVAGRVVTGLAVGGAAGAAGNVGAQLGSDLADQRLSSVDAYGDAALTGAEFGMALGGGATGAGEVAGALAARSPAVAARLAALSRRFPTLPPDGPIMQALTSFGEHAGAAAARGTIRVLVTPTQLVDALAAQAVKATPAVRAAIARAVGRGDALAARALEMAGIEPGNLGGPPPAPAGATAGGRATAPASDLIAVDLSPGLGDDAAATIVKAEVEGEVAPGTAEAREPSGAGPSADQEPSAPSRPMGAVEEPPGDALRQRSPQTAEETSPPTTDSDRVLVEGEPVSQSSSPSGLISAAEVDTVAARIRATGRLIGDMDLWENTLRKAKANVGDHGALGEIEAVARWIDEGRLVEVLPERQNAGVTNPDYRVDGHLREVKTRSRALGKRWIKDEIADANTQFAGSGLVDPATGLPETGTAELQLRGEVEDATLESVERQIRGAMTGRNRSVERVRVLHNNHLLGEWARLPDGTIQRIFPAL
jgi:hypothetical protein